MSFSDKELMRFYARSLAFLFSLGLLFGAVPAFAESSSFAFQFKTEPVLDGAGNSFHSEVTVFEIDLRSPEAADQLTATSEFLRTQIEANKRVPKVFISAPLSESTKTLLRINPLLKQSEIDEVNEVVFGKHFSVDERGVVEISPAMLGIVESIPDHAWNFKKTDRSPASKKGGVESAKDSALWDELDKLYIEKNKTFRYRLIWARGIGNGVATGISILSGGAGVLRSAIIGGLTGIISGMVQKHTGPLTDYVSTNKYTSKMSNLLRSWIGMNPKPYAPRTSKMAAQYAKWYSLEFGFAGIFTLVSEALHTLPPTEFLGMAGPLAVVTKIAATSGLFMAAQGTFENVKIMTTKAKILELLKKGETAAALTARKTLDKAFTIGSYIAVSGMAMQMLGIESGSWISLGILGGSGAIEYSRYKSPKVNAAFTAMENSIKRIWCRRKLKPPSMAITRTDLEFVE